MMRTNVVAVVTAVVVIALVAIDATPFAQSTPTFDVVSVKKSRDDGTHANAGLRGTIAFEGGTLRLKNVTVREVIEYGFQVQERQIIGGGSWIGWDRFDVTAKTDGVPNRTVLGAMVQQLLVERFGLKSHAEKKTVVVPLSKKTETFDALVIDAVTQPGPD